MPRFTAQVAMRWSDMDAYGHVNHVPFLTYAEEARGERFKSVPLSGSAPGAAGTAAAPRALWRRPSLRRYCPVLEVDMDR